MITAWFQNGAGGLPDGFESVLMVSWNGGESYATEKNIASQLVFSDPLGNIVRVKDVAEVVREYDVPDSYIRVNGKSASLLQGKAERQ